MHIRMPISAIAAVIGIAAAPQAAGAVNQFKHIVVIYQENHSFDNLYGLWGKVNGKSVDGLSKVKFFHTRQVRADNKTPYKCLLMNDVNLTSPPLPASCTDYFNGAPFQSAFSNAPFKINDYIAATDSTCPDPRFHAPKKGTVKGSGRPGGCPDPKMPAPKEGFVKGSGLPGGCTRDLVHSFYNHQYQIHQGRQDRFVTGSDAAGLAMGYYDTTKLPIYSYLQSRGAPNYVIADHFFQGAFGGSFLNHQWLIAAATPVFAGALNDASEDDLHSVVDQNGMPGCTPLYISPLGTAAKNSKDSLLTASCNPPVGRPSTPACGEYAVNTIQPFNWPYKPDAADARRRLPRLTNPTIGDRLSAAKVDWAWYSGGWSNANGDVNAPGWTNGNGPACSDRNADLRAPGGFPRCPDELFQYHHQPFNYYVNYAPGTPARADHLRDEAEFIQAAHNGTLRAVSFVKPVGEENEHPGYASEPDGSSHLVNLIKAIVDGPNGQDTLIIVTYDEFGGSWDHVPPPPYSHHGRRASAHDEWGPGSRVPTLLIAKKFKQSGVDHREHDTTSILKLIEERFHLEPLSSRDKRVISLKSALKAAKTTR